MSKKKWLDKEIKILKKQYPEQGSNIPELDRTKSAIRNRAKKLRISCAAWNRWTEKELEILKRKYPKKGSDIPELNKSKYAIQARAYREDTKKENQLYVWTKEEIKILKKKYPEQGYKIEELDKRKAQIDGKAHQLGIQRKNKGQTIKNEKKYCSICREEKPLSEFYKQSSTKSGYKSACKECINQKREEGDYQEYQRKYMREKYRNDPKYYINILTGTNIRASIKNGCGGWKWENWVGYTFIELLDSLESQFTEDMNWDNYGDYWHMGHIKPASKFDFTSREDEEFKEYWSLDNLRPVKNNLNDNN